MLSLNSIVTVRVSAETRSSAARAFSAGLILAPAESSAVPEEHRLRRYWSAADMLADGFDPASPAYLAAPDYFAAGPAPDRVFVSLYPSSDSLPEALTAALSAPLNAAADGEGSFYGLYACETDPERLLALAADLPSRPSPFLLFGSAAGSVQEAAAPGSLFSRLREQAPSRCLGLFGADTCAAAALMGTAMGLVREYASSAFSLCYKAVPGALPVDLTESEIAALNALNANVYVTRGHRLRLLENGCLFSGLRFDEALSLDRISAALQEAAVDLLTSGAGKLPQTDETSALFINRFTAILSAFAAQGILATAPWRGKSVGSLTPGDTVENGFRLWADSYDEQSDEDRRAHRAQPIHAAMCLSGSVESLVINVDVTL